MPFFPQYRLSHLTQAYLLHFGAVWALDSRERPYHHNSLRDLEPRQLFQATRPQARLIHLRPGRRLNESYRHRVGHPSRSRHNLYSCHASLRLNDSLDLLRADQEATKTYGVANSRFVDEVGASQGCDIARAEHAVSIDRAFGCRRIFQILGEARRCVDPQLAGRAERQRVPGLRIAYRKPGLTAYGHTASEQAVLTLPDREQRLHFGTAVEAMGLHAQRLRGRDRGRGGGMKRGKTGEAHRVETASDERSGNAAEHIVAADHVGDPVLTDQPDRRLTVELCEAYDMSAASNRGHRRSVAEGAAERYRPEQRRIRCIQSDTAGGAPGGAPPSLLVLPGPVFAPRGAPRGRSVY